MSNFSPFDTLQFSTQLREAGFTQQQADTLTRGLQEALTATVATQADLAEAKAELETDIAEVKAELKTDIAEVKAELKTDLAGFRAEIKTDLAALRADMSTAFQAVYRHLWLMGMGIIGAMFLLLRYFAP